ncbi:AfsR/SARP family transcriptional regulator [Plantactinospora sp. CA-294935]|uniref:AfsR/SARP family transcriptional regulator n=1 Tax=Plantactinospora sp. CA-294935 TaxID=3240012 RepID=UPI003D8CD517
MSPPPRGRLRLRFALLGPVRVWRDGRPVRVNGVRPRTLLTALLLEPNRPVSLDHLIELIWEGPPPVSAVANLRTYATRLRTSLGGSPEAGRSRLATTSGGYLLRVGPEELDLQVFADRLRLGRTALAAGDPARAATQLAAALALWRGDAASDVPRSPALAARLSALDESRQLAIECHLRARLGLGGSEDLVGDLRRLTLVYPTRETLWGQLMVALYRRGDVAPALAAYGRAREALREQLGVEPGPELIALHRAILNRDPRLGSAPQWLPSVMADGRHCAHCQRPEQPARPG